MAGLRVPLSTLRRRPCDRQRMTRGRDGWLGLSRVTLAFTTPRRSPGALSVQVRYRSPNGIEPGNDFWCWGSGVCKPLGPADCGNGKIRRDSHPAGIFDLPPGFVRPRPSLAQGQCDARVGALALGCQFGVGNRLLSVPPPGECATEDHE